MTTHSSMLNLVRRTCEGAADMDDFVGVYEPEPEETEELEEYEGQFRYVNCGPEKVRQLLATEQDPKEVEALKVAESFWGQKGGYASDCEAGSMNRGEPRPDIRFGSMREMVSSSVRVDGVKPLGSLRAGGIPSRGEATDASNYHDYGIIDWDMMLSFGPAPVPMCDDDWF